MALEIFGKSEVQKELDQLEEQIATLENQVSSDLSKHVSDIDKKITKIVKAQEGLKKKAVKSSSDLRTLTSVSNKNTSIISKQVEENIPIEIGKLQHEIAHVNENLATTKLVLDKMMGILKQISSPENRLNQKVLKLEDQMEVLGKIDLIHLVDKLEIIKEQLQKAQDNFVPPEISEKLQAFDMKLHEIDKRIRELEDQTIRPIEEVETR